MVHPSTKSIEAVTFFVAHNEGSVLISCTGLDLGLIKPHASLDHLPPGSNFISSSADQPINDKSQLNVHMLLEKSKTFKLITSAEKISAMCSRKEQSQLIPKSKEYHVNQCGLQENKGSTNEQEYKANVCIEGDKNCQETLNVHMWPVQPATKSHVICGHYQDQQNYNLTTRKRIK